MTSSVRTAVAVAAVLLALSLGAAAVDRSKFKACSDSGFCRRARSAAPGQAPPVVAPGALAAASASSASAPLSADGRVTLTVSGIAGDIARLTVTEEGRFRPPPGTALVDALEPSPVALSRGPGLASVRVGTTRVDVAEGGVLTVNVSVGVWEHALEINARGLFLFERGRAKPPPPEPVQEPERPAEPEAEAEPEPEPEERDPDDEDARPKLDEDVPLEEHDEPPPPMDDEPAQQAPQQQRPEDDGAFDEHFGGHHDSKPRGPTAVGLDVTFVGAQRIYGLPEHASSVALKNTKDAQESGGYSDPYRLYNLDVFEFECNNPMSLYGAVPLVLAHSPEKGTVGFFWLNPSETWVDVGDSEGGKATRWLSESGAIDVFVLPGPTPNDVFEQYTRLTGRSPLPPLFSLAYHQCRWNYKDDPDVRDVDANFEAHDIPYDVIWLDIEHTDSKKYFTWDDGKFPDPKGLQDTIAAKGRKMVTIVDPHIKREGGYHVHSQAESNGYYVKRPNGNEVFEGHCWPGSSSWVDFLNPAAREWWGSLFSLSSYTGSTNSLHIWNDMNEPSVFSGPEVTMPKDLIHHGSVEHRDLHNMYGLLNHMSTYGGLMKRENNARPFVLTRSFFSGTQRYAAVWTGDTQGNWEHLRQTIPMLISLGIGGIPFVGADVGGFFGNPDTELLVRWYQAGAFYPFFRAHAHIETRRREPWLFGEPTTTQLRDIVKMRYQLLPFWYTAFHETSTTGRPVLRALWAEFPRDAQAMDVDDQFMVGSQMLVKPVTAAGQTSTPVYLPGTPDVLWYNYFKRSVHKGGQTINVDTPLDTVPVFVRGGSVIPRQDRPRRSSTQMAKDPYTLLVSLDSKQRAAGELYVDDGKSFDHLSRAAFSLASIEFDGKSLRSTRVLGDRSNYNPQNAIERVIIVGLSSAPAKASVRVGPAAPQDADVSYDAATRTAVIRKPAGVVVSGDWTITLA